MGKVCGQFVDVVPRLRFAADVLAERAVCGPRRSEDLERGDSHRAFLDLDRDSADVESFGQSGGVK
ncbi:MAG: hypothetical protein ACJAR2_001357 [Ilumatobacter sp.]|jgi:hypothetical protein